MPVGDREAIDAVPHLRDAMAAVTDRHQSVQQTSSRRSWTAASCASSPEPTRLTNGKRVPGLKLDHPRQLALMHGLVRFAHIAVGDALHHA
jgi:hypothetical protein